MKKTIAIATGLLLATGIFANKAQAVDGDVEFSGTALGNVCTLGSPVNGIMKVRPDNNAMMTSEPELSDGTRGSITLHCSIGSATISVGPPVVSGTGLPNHSGGNSFVFIPGGGAVLTESGAGSATQVSSGANVVLPVSLNVINGTTPIPAGTYGYKVTVTATPL